MALSKAQKMEAVAELERLKKMVTEFQSSELGKYYQEVLAAALGEVDKELRTADTLERVKYLQGKGEGLNYWQLLPVVLIESWTVRLAEAREDLEEGND